MDEKELNEQTLDHMLHTDIDELLDEWMHESPVPAPESEIAEEPVEAEKKPVKQSKKDGWQGTVLMYLHDLVYLLAGLILVFLLLFRVVVVSGTSMNSTLLDGDYLLLLSSTFYHEPQYGDIIVASKESFDNGAPIVKRVIATEGQWVGIDFTEGVVYVGSSKDTLEPLTEPYTLTPTNIEEGFTHTPEDPLEIPEGTLFVMGDNRNGSKDSRHPEIGLVDRREVLGKVVFLLVPGTNEGEEEQDFGRIGVVD